MPPGRCWQRRDGDVRHELVQRVLTLLAASLCGLFALFAMDYLPRPLEHDPVKPKHNRR
jgi:hypothetical protein